MLTIKQILKNNQTVGICIVLRESVPAKIKIGFT